MHALADGLDVRGPDEGHREGLASGLSVRLGAAAPASAFGEPCHCLRAVGLTTVSDVLRLRDSAPASAVGEHQPSPCLKAPGLAAVRVASDLYRKRAEIFGRVIDCALREQNETRAGAESGQPASYHISYFLKHAEAPEELSLNGALAAGKDDAVDPGEILRLSYFHCVGPEGAEHMLVLDKCSLNRQYANLTHHLRLPESEIHAAAFTARAPP